jgi:hypothetical protein
MFDPTWLCVGSILAALFGLFVLILGSGRRAWRWVWIMLALILLVGAGFGAAETVFQLAAEQEQAASTAREELSLAAATETPAVPAIPGVATTMPEVEPAPSRTAVPTATATASPSPTPLPRATREPDASPTPQAFSAPAPAGRDALGRALIPAESAVLERLADAPYYALDVTVDLDALTVTGTVAITYTNNTSDSLDAIYLRLYPNAAYYAEGATEIHVVNVAGRAADFGFEDAQRTILKIPLSQALSPSERTQLQIAFTVQVPRRADRFGYDEGVMSLGHWYPMLAVYDDEGWNLDPYVALGDAFYSEVGRYVVHVTVPAGTVVAATGLQVGEASPDSASVTHVYASAGTRDFALALSQDYRTVSEQMGDTLVTSYYLPGHERGGQQALQVVTDALVVYNERFGRYPYTEMDVAETAFTVMGSPGGMEFPGLIFISSEFYGTDSFYASELDVVVAHEVAHQWWYGVVGNNQVDEPWLDEAFATYGSIVYLEEEQDALAAQMGFLTQAVLPYQMVQMMGVDGPLQGSLLDYEEDLITYQALVYGKGALFLAKLREMLGDDDFFRLLQYHYRAHKYGLLARDDFRRSIAVVLNQTPQRRDEALAFYDAIVVRGEALEGVSGITGLEGLLDGTLAPEELDDLMQLLEDLLGGMGP